MKRGALRKIKDESLLAFLFHLKCTSLESVHKAKEKLKLKDLFLIYLFEDDSKHKKPISLVRFLFSCCNAHTVVLIISLSLLLCSSVSVMGSSLSTNSQ